MPTNFAPPVNVSPLIKFGRWSLLFLGIGYGAFWQSRYTKKELALKDIKAREKAARDERLAQEKALKSADDTFFESDITKAPNYRKTDDGGAIVIEGRGTRITIDGLSGDETVSVSGAGELGDKETIIIAGPQGHRILVENKLKDPKTPINFEPAGPREEVPGDGSVLLNSNDLSSDEVKDISLDPTTLMPTIEPDPDPSFENVTLTTSDVPEKIETESEVYKENSALNDNFKEDIVSETIQTQDLADMNTVENSNFSDDDGYKADDFIKINSEDPPDNIFYDYERDYPLRVTDISLTFKQPSADITNIISESDFSIDLDLFNECGPHEKRRGPDVSYFYLKDILNNILENKLNSFVKKDNVIRFCKLERTQEAEGRIEFKTDEDFFLSGFFSI